MVRHECTTWNLIYCFPLWVWKRFFSPFFLVRLSKSETHCLDKVAGERKKGDKLRKVFLLLLSLKNQPWAGLILPIMHCPNTAIIYLTLQISRVQKWGLLNSIFQIYGLIWGFRNVNNTLTYRLLRNEDIRMHINTLTNKCYNAIQILIHSGPKKHLYT